MPRNEATRTYIADHYEDIRSIHASGLDALIVTGANVANPRLDEQAFYAPLTEVIGWAADNVTSVLCSCLSTHALMKFLHGIDRRPLPRKQWGVYSHEVVAPGHPLLRGIRPRLDVPHSRYNEITREQVVDAGLTILIESPEAGVHAAVSADQFRRVYFQGHPEYDANSLLKEYKREVLRYFGGERELPPLPEHYISGNAAAIITPLPGTSAARPRRRHAAAGVSRARAGALPGEHLGRRRQRDLRQLARAGPPAHQPGPPPSVRGRGGPAPAAGGPGGPLGDRVRATAARRPQMPLYWASFDQPSPARPTDASVLSFGPVPSPPPWSCPSAWA